MLCTSSINGTVQFCTRFCLRDGNFAVKTFSKCSDEKKGLKSSVNYF